MSFSHQAASECTNIGEARNFLQRTKLQKDERYFSLIMFFFGEMARQVVSDFTATAEAATATALWLSNKRRINIPRRVSNPFPLLHKVHYQGAD